MASRLVTFLGATLFAAGSLSVGCGSTGSSEIATDASPNPEAAADAGGGAGSGGASGHGGSTEIDGGPALGPAIHAKAIAVGVHHACAVLDDDRVSCWGSDEWGDLGDGSSSSSDLGMPLLRGAVIVSGLAGVTRIVIGSGSVCLVGGSCVLGDTTCALLADGTAKCWGLGAYGQLGNDREGRDYFEPLPVALKLAGIVDLALGGGTGCAVIQDGTVSCWGNNASGYLGFTSSDCGPFYGFATDTVPPPQSSPCEKAPRAVPGISDAARVAVGGSHQCVVHSDSSVTCWGSNVWGELGSGNRQLLDSAPVAPDAPIAGLTANAIAVGAGHTCAVLADASVDCWGENGSGQLGLGNSSNDPGWVKPTAVPRLTNVKALRLSGDTSMALVADGTAFAWGDINYVFADPPDPTSAAIDSPTKMKWITDAIDIATSDFINCTLHADHTVTCSEPDTGEHQVRFAQ